MKATCFAAVNRRSFPFRSEFRNTKREKYYFQQEMQHVLPQIRPFLLVLGIFYVLFLIPDFYLNVQPATFHLILAIRLLTFFVLLIFYFKLPVLIGNDRYIFWITAYELMFSLSFLLIYLLYESPNLLIQSWGVILIILAFFLLPNRLSNTVGVSLFLYFNFLVLTMLIKPVFEYREMAATCIYPLVIITFGTFVTSRFNYYKRLQYLYAERLSYLSTHDALTRLCNRSKFEEELQNAINMAKRYRAPFSLIFYDFDDFKMINDRFGHPMGDQILRTQGKVIKKHIREVDILARWGGEEFVIILPHTDLDGALAAAAKIKSVISEYPFPTGNITCSIGVTCYREEDTKETIMKRIDKFLYIAKNAGKDGVASDLGTYVLCTME